MPLINLIVAQAVVGWIAPFTIADLVLQMAPVLEPWKPYLTGVLIGIVISTGGFIGSGIAASLPRPSVLMVLAAVGFALAGTFIALAAFAPAAGASEIMFHLATFFPVLMAIFGYTLASPRPTSGSR